jgi:hypothetical protein
MIRRFSALLAALLLVTGCAMGGLDYKGLGAELRGGNCPGAVGQVEGFKDKYGNNRQLIYHMDSGMVNLLCGNHEESNRQLQEGDRLAEDLWTKSLSKEAASFLVNDYTIPYSGEDFERVMLNLFSAVNYSLMKDYEGALVEARRINSKLTDYNDKYEEKSVYSEDAFARYLSGTLYEIENPRDMQALDSAYIDYFKAYKAYKTYAEHYATPMPRIFLRDLLRVAEATGRIDELKDEANGMQWVKHSEARGMGRIVLLHLTGTSPVKVEDSIVASAPKGPIKLAFPRFVAHPPACTDSELVVKSPGTGTALNAKSELVEDINAIAVKNLDDRKGRVIVKAIARAVIKQAAVDAASEQFENEGAKLLAKFTGRVLAAATEVADTRSWRTLPGEIRFVRTFVPPGSYDVSVRACGAVHDLGNVELEAGQTRFLLVNTMY